MARSRKYGEDLTYAEAHRTALPEQYKRSGHRIDMADRDWTENCHCCRKPIALIEEIRDIGQNLDEKSTHITAKLADAAGIPAFLVAWRNARPRDIQDRIDALDREKRALEALHPIDRITARWVAPERSELVPLEPNRWWEWLYILHREHHYQFGCAWPSHGLPPMTRFPQMDLVRSAHPLYSRPGQLAMGFSKT